MTHGVEVGDVVFYPVAVFVGIPEGLPRIEHNFVPCEVVHVYTDTALIRSLLDDFWTRYVHLSEIGGAPA